MIVALFQPALMILTEQILANEQREYPPRVLENCYRRNSVLVANIDRGQLCVEFDMEFDPDCAQLPPGVYMDIQVSNMPDYTIRGEFQNFDYQRTKELCYDCPLIGNDTQCDFIQQTAAVQVQLKSLTRATSLPIGKILIAHAQFAECFDATRSHMFWASKSAKLQIYATVECPEFGVDFSEYSIKLTRIDGTEDVIDINLVDEDGNTIITETVVGYLVEVTFDYDFSQYIQNFYEDIKLYLKLETEGVSVVQTVLINSMESESLPTMFQDPQFIIWAQRFTLTADPVPNAKELDETYLATSTGFTARYEFVDRTTGENLENIIFSETSFSFQVINRNIICDDRADGGVCSGVLSRLQTYDLSRLEIQMHYYFYDAGSNLLLYSTVRVTDVRSTCWVGVFGTYRSDAICGTFTANEGSQHCPYVNETEITFTVTFDDYQLSQAMRYSTQQEEVCVYCSDLACISKLAQLYRSKSAVSFSFRNDDNDFTLNSASNYSENYQGLKKKIFIVGLISSLAMVAITIYTILKHKQLLRVKPKAAVKGLGPYDDL
ncbi:hypothetical protein SS50377_27157 [Spironucleus salmonicida]|uniref:Uncharacterized protein n=1 Tax=Spironucleus salmonicida TaxID=348837 RepID=V6LH15_9EUKA|nr:hypothetical protein SS50377_27157 [Spironucleus salmonicida]|eukprot:EST43845.1 Hypothetical protein SS50377_16389 [Spironucleus salmonicida]